MNENYSHPDLTVDDKDKLMDEISGKLSSTSHLMDNLLVWIKRQMDGINPSLTEVNLTQIIRRNISLMKREIQMKSSLLKKGLTALKRSMQRLKDISLKIVSKLSKGHSTNNKPTSKKLPEEPPSKSRPKTSKPKPKAKAKPSQSQAPKRKNGRRKTTGS